MYNFINISKTEEGRGMATNLEDMSYSELAVLKDRLNIELEEAVEYIDELYDEWNTDIAEGMASEWPPIIREQAKANKLSDRWNQVCDRMAELELLGRAE